MLKVAIKRSDYSNVEEKIREGINLIGGIKKFIKKGDKVLLKPNLLRAADPKKAITTNPAIVRAIAKIVKEVGAEIYLGDSPAFGNVEKVAENSGIKKICDEFGIKILTFEGKVFKIDGKLIKSLILFKNFKDYKIINLPKLKTHSFAMYTGAMKNLFGIVPGMEKSKLHLRFQDKETFSQMLQDLNSEVKPVLNIMDGVLGMEGDGPNSGDPRYFNFIGVSEDAMALDLVCSKLMGFSDNEIPILDHNLKVEMIGDKIDVVKDLKKPKKMNLFSYLRPLRDYLVAIPACDEKKCISCRACFNICPAGAIKMERCPIFDYNKCIKCYSCHEVCPTHAIYLKKSFIMKILGI